MTDKKVMTIQDVSCYGQCSLTVALPIISACGVETAILPSAVLSTHTAGFSGFTFRDLTDDIAPIKDHWVKEGISFDCIMTGYLGSVRQIGLVRELFRDVLKDGGLKIVDPAMADNGKLYYGFDEAYAHEMGKLCGEADIILPNITEACYMCDIPYVADSHSREYIDSLLAALSRLGAKKVVLKGVNYEEGKLGITVFDAETGEKQEYFTEKISRSYHGTGDCYAAALTGAVMQGKDIFEAACLAVDFIVECIKNTLDDETHGYGVKFERTLPMLADRINR